MAVDRRFDLDSLEGRRDRALLHFGFASGGRRRSEIADADLADLRPLPQGGFVYRLEHSKTQQPGRVRRPRPTSRSSVSRPRRCRPGWTPAASPRGRSSAACGRTRGSARASRAKSVASIVQRRAHIAGVSGDFGGHSLRSGFVTEGDRQGVALPAPMAMTEHRSVASVIGYFQAGGIAENPAGHLLDRD